MDWLLYALLGVCALALTALAIVASIAFCHSNKKKASLEGKFYFDSRKFVLRVTNSGVRDIVIVEIGLKCSDKFAGYRPLFAQTEDINNIPHRITRGDVASYRKEIERFTFRQSEVDQLKVLNPYVYFYAKDAEDTLYTVKSDIKFAQYLAELMRS